MGTVLYTFDTPRFSTVLGGASKLCVAGAPIAKRGWSTHSSTYIHTLLGTRSPQPRVCVCVLLGRLFVSLIIYTYIFYRRWRRRRRRPQRPPGGLHESGRSGRQQGHRRAQVQGQRGRGPGKKSCFLSQQVESECRLKGRALVDRARLLKFPLLWF